MKKVLISSALVSALLLSQSHVANASAGGMTLGK